MGKAKQLRNRMRQYLTGQDERVKIPLMMAQVASFEYIVCASEVEALVLEKNLIKQFVPPFNVDFKDDKSYPFIAITNGEVFPAIKYTREKHKQTTRYFGPYTDARAAREVVDTVRRIVPICSASCAEYRRLCRKLGEHAVPEALESLKDAKACFDYHVGLGMGPCCGACTPEEYAEAVEKVERFLSGQRGELVDDLKEQMQEAAADLDFERAARIRDRIESVEVLREKQHATSGDSLEADVIGLFREETVCGVHVLQVREGRIINGNEFVLDKGLDTPGSVLIENFMLKYYDSADIPRQILVAELPEDSDILEELLTEELASRHGTKVHISVPQKGEKANLLRMAETNAYHTLNRFKVRTSYEDERTNEALMQLESALALPNPPMRIECFDISTIHGRYSVASMVVFTGGRPDKSQYRRFKIRMDSPEANDFAMMSEVLARRYAPERMEDERFGRCPDLLILDGGKPQLTAAMQQLGALGLDIPMAGLAKRDEELFVPWSDEGPVVLPGGSASLYLVKRVRDEAHRFAITFHRELRGKGMTKSLLDDVPGLGPKRRKLLMKEFKSMKRLREASAEDIAAVKGIPTEVAASVYEVLHESDDKD